MVLLIVYLDGQFMLGVSLKSTVEIKVDSDNSQF